jgi:hypothetical protein
MSTALIVLEKKCENKESEQTPEQRNEQDRLAAYYEWKAKEGNLWADKADWFEAEDYHFEGITD